MDDSNDNNDERLPTGGTPFEKLVNLMAQLRDPENGCPWDIEQTFSSVAPYTIEEAYEVLDAIEASNMESLQEELGDLLLQVVFHSQIASEANLFNQNDVVEGIVNKMIRRHPHVFGTAQNRTAEAQQSAWEAQKAIERSAKSNSDSAIDGVALALPALLRAAKIQKRAARTGFDWTNPEDIFSKIEEETAEVRDAMAERNQNNITEEIGDLLFVIANLARRLEVDPEDALRRANTKFERRFKTMETLAKKQSRSFADLSLQEQETLWKTVKALEVKD